MAVLWLDVTVDVKATRNGVGQGASVATAFCTAFLSFYTAVLKGLHL